MRLVPFLVAMLAVAGSAGTATADEAATPEGRTFVSVAVTGEQIPGNGPLTLSFADGRLSAFAGCNRGSGPADLSGGHLTTRLATTMMACPAPLGDADAWMARFLAAGPAWSLNADTLTLSTDTATVTLRDKSVLHPARPLIGTGWRVDTLLTGQVAMTSVVLEQARPGFTLHADRTVTGWTGCHTFYGRAEIVGDTVTFGPLNTSGPICDGELGDLERSILRVLHGPVQASIDGDRLTLTGADGTGMVLRAE
jgi:heat shock protein HslJ